MEGDRTMCKTIYEKSRNPLCVQLDMESAEIIVVEFSVPQSQSAMRAIRYGARSGRIFAEKLKSQSAMRAIRYGEVPQYQPPVVNVSQSTMRAIRYGVATTP